MDGRIAPVLPGVDGRGRGGGAPQLGVLLVGRAGGRYCDFYDANPGDAALLALFAALTESPEREGVQLLARGADRSPLGFATLYWTWSTTGATGIG